MTKSVSLFSVSAALAFSALLVSGTAAQASPLFTQMTTPPTQEFYSDSQAQFVDGVLAADDFTLGSTGTIRAVSWQGAYSPAGAPGLADSFHINIYADPIGSTLLASFALGADVNRSAAGGTVGAGDILYNYVAALDGGGFTATAGTRYWISIVNDAAFSFADAWTWAGGASGAMRASVNNGSSWVTTAGSTNFALDSQPVPEPATLGLLSLGVGLIGVARSRRRQRQ